MVHGQEALERLKEYSFDVIILDVNLPIMDGRTFLKLLREKSNTTPVIAATSNSMLDHKLEMFDIGADDYITKPFDFPELEARVKALYKRKSQTVEEVLSMGDIQIDILRHTVTRK